MKFKWVVIALAAVVGISSIPSISASAKMQITKTVPTSYHGTWYGANLKNSRELIYISNQYVITGSYSKYNAKTHQIKYDYDTGYLPKGTGSNKLLFKKVLKGDGQAGTTYTFNQGSDIVDQLPAYWVSKMKIKGKMQPVLKAYENYGEVQVYTKKPVAKDYSYTIKQKNVGSEIGK
ncbi:hypothetical protein MOO44_00675 (plasmid) [Nicoliella spurrieriana]|uniref:Uncharacterized protein n=1 Tax=Nicoliella spurrieriana TaxID=2925830 RepID=A0A976RQU3_9LACO|nr:hypothetical protein [Nicoliella spurrieriana]UQS86187.1 hypothetical protein MOO44_00675 [Nicoliella spurrieriana]